jgi:hypothetical protein
MRVSRRRFAVGAAALALLGGGFAFNYRRIIGPWYPPTPYDDLLGQIVDRRPAATLGQTAVRTLPHSDAATLAVRLRRPGFALAERARGDAAAGRVTEVSGWVVPESVAQYAALAAQFA